MTDFPVDHLSASSITTFLRCPRQWQEKYVYKREGPSNSSLIIGSAVHLALSRLLKDEEPYWGRAWDDVVEENEGKEIVWKDSPEKSHRIWIESVHSYYESVGKYLTVVETEKEISLDIEGVPIPVVGFVDIVTPERTIDVKTTGYFDRRVSLNPEWKLQANIYQIAYPLPAEFHVLTRSKTDPVVLPDSYMHELHVNPPESGRTEKFVYGVWTVMEHYWKTFNTAPWPGNVIHPWAAKYCSVEECCQR